MRSGSVVPALVALLLAASSASATVATPTVDGPIPGAPFIQTTSFDLASVGYMQEEYFISGTATAFSNTAPLGNDGLWDVAPASTAPYKTRIVVYRPIDARRFSGTVFVEWLNVSGGVDAGPDWTFGHVELIREGAAWVGVSAQFVGVEGGPALVGVVSLPLKTVDPVRYGSLSHPGDSFSYDIFSQAGQAVRHSSGPKPLGDLVPKAVVAIGESQSAFRMVTYADAIHPIAHIYDGYFIHSRGQFGANLSEAPQPAIPVPGAAEIRSDLGVPTLTFETETDLTFLGYFGARQDDSRMFRLWEVAGTSHADTYTVLTGMGDTGTSPDINDLVINASPLPGLITCPMPINSGPQHFVLNAALAAFNRWVRHGRAPKPAPRIVVASPPAMIQHDVKGVALGGIRTPQVDVPIAAFTGLQSGSSLLCLLFGTTTPFDSAQLTSLYPTHEVFVTAYYRAARRAQHKGFLLPADVKLLREWAAGSSIGG